MTTFAKLRKRVPAWFSASSVRVSSPEVAQKYTELGYDGQKMLAPLSAVQKRQQTLLGRRLQRQRNARLHAWHDQYAKVDKQPK